LVAGQEGEGRRERIKKVAVRGSKGRARPFEAFDRVDFARIKYGEQVGEKQTYISCE